MQTSLQNNLFSNRLNRIIELKGYKSANEFATKGLGYSSSEKIARLFRVPDSNPSYEILSDIAKKFADVNMSWLISGIGEPIINRLAPNVAPIIAPNTKKSGSFPAVNAPRIITIDSVTSEENTIFVTAKAAAGYLNGYADPEFTEQLQTINLPGLSGQTHRAFEIKGNSMLPTHHSGSIAIGRYVESFNDIRDRRVYIVVTKTEGIVLKRILNRIAQDGKLILMSDNDNKKEYPNYAVEPEDVLELWYWRGSFIRESPEPGTVYSRINDLEGRMVMLEQLLKGK